MKINLQSMLTNRAKLALLGLATFLCFAPYSAAAYTNALFNSCFTNIFAFGLCPLNAVVYFPYIVEFCAFIIVNRRTKPSSYALSFLASAIMSYLFLGLVVALAAGSTVIDLYLATSLLLSVCWIAAFAYEISRPRN